MLRTDQRGGAQAGPMALAKGDIIVGKAGERWTVNEIYHNGYWLTRNSDDALRYLSRRELCRVFGGGEGRKGESDG